MQRSSVFLLSMGFLIIAGLALSVAGNQIIFEELEKNESKIAVGQKILVQKDMSEGQGGVFAVGVLGMGSGSVVYASVEDPFGVQIIREQVDKETYEGYFEATMSGNYTLTIENAGDEEKFVTGYIGPEPDASKQTLAFVSIYILFIGLIGMIVAVIYAVIKRRKTS